MPNGVTLSYIDEELALLMRQAGVDTIFLAIESGSKRVLKEIIVKPISFDRIKPTVDLLRRVGIFTTAFFVIGLPGETDEERQETHDFILDMGFDWAFFNYATPLRGSRLFEQCKRNGWLAPEHLRIGSIDMSDYVINAPASTRKSSSASSSTSISRPTSSRTATCATPAMISRQRPSWKSLIATRASRSRITI